MNIIFLTRPQILRLHQLALEEHGGQDGIRDQDLLEAAIAMPEATFGGELLHPDVPSIAAAYLFHLCQNHPFIDSNERVGLLAALVFLDIHSFSLSLTQTERERMTLAVASGDLSKSALTELIRRSLEPREDS